MNHAELDALAVFPDEPGGDEYAVRLPFAADLAKRGVIQITDRNCGLRGRVYARLTPGGWAELAKARGRDAR